jgi:hypothetical protein
MRTAWTEDPVLLKTFLTPGTTLLSQIVLRLTYCVQCRDTLETQGGIPLSWVPGDKSYFSVDPGQWWLSPLLKGQRVAQMPPLLQAVSIGKWQEEGREKGTSSDCMR